MAVLHIKTTDGNDDWVGLADANRITTKAEYTIGNHSFPSGVSVCYVVCDDNIKDEQVLNNSIKKLLAKYLDQVDVKGLTPAEAEQKKRDIVNKLNTAIRAAIPKLKKAQHNNNYENVYGYNPDGNTGTHNYDGHVSVQACLLQIMYEMESEIAKEIFK